MHRLDADASQQEAIVSSHTTAAAARQFCDAS
jgi:hypothetical protein